jgi:hypothetical protein
MDKTYTVIKDIKYYTGDCQHPNGYSITIARMSDLCNDLVCIGSMTECLGWLATLTSERQYLGHAEVSYDYRICDVVDNNADYQTWLDNYVDWDGCPSGDYDDNCVWAAVENYKNNGVVPIDDSNGRLLLIDLRNP